MHDDPSPAPSRGSRAMGILGIVLLGCAGAGTLLAIGLGLFVIQWFGQGMNL